MRKQRYSLNIHITTLFMALVTFVSVTLIGINYFNSHHLLTETAKKLSRDDALVLESAFQRKIGPILTALDFMSTSSSIDSHDNPGKNLDFWAALKLTFQKNKNLVALFYGNDDGDFTLVRSLATNADRERFNAPEKAALMVNSTRASGLNAFYFYDGAYREVGRNKFNDNTFDPRIRPWYRNAEDDGATRITQPYEFFFLKKPGVTLSKLAFNKNSVVGADFTLESLSNQIAEMGHSPSTRIVLFDNQFEVLAHHNIEVDQTIDQTLANGVFSAIMNRSSSQMIYETVTKDGEDWSVTLPPVSLNKGTRLLLAEATPQSELLTELISIRDQQISIAIILMILCTTAVWLLAGRLTLPLKELVRQTGNISRFDFRKTRYEKSAIREVANLTDAIELMEHTLYDLFNLLRETAKNDDFSLLAKTITKQSFIITKAETIVLYVKDEHSHRYQVEASHAIIPFKLDLDELLSTTAWIDTALKKGETVHLNREENALARYRDSLYNSDLYFFPLQNRNKELVGMLVLGYERSITPEQFEKHDFLRELLSFAELAKENIDRIDQQKEMLSVFVELIAAAIDKKSPHTANHCQRVPKLTEMLVQAAAEDQDYFPFFSMSKSQWEELHLASWLHDCGKVTTPDHVIDKGTKLETVYDRIHEIRMRFEVLKLDAEIDYWRELCNGGNEIQLKQELMEKHRVLDNEFNFIAQCNTGQQRMDDEALSKLQTIAKRQWTRTLNDDLGISLTEQSRRGATAKLPVQENLLSDKQEHKILWGPEDKHNDDWKSEFVLQPGELKNNRGELYNLSISRGTLNDEERFIINDHIIQTIEMIDCLPFPAHLKGVPEIVGGHHERIDGGGYPRGIKSSELSVQARVMAVADIFEALTSRERPYKKAHSLEETTRIMTDMAIGGHLDPKLFLLFLEQNLDEIYAHEFLSQKSSDPSLKQENIVRLRNYIKTLA